MKIVQILRLGKDFMKLMSDFDLRVKDYKHLEMYDKYEELRSKGEKLDYVLSLLSHRYKMSESTIKRIIKRLSKDVKM